MAWLCLVAAVTGVVVAALVLWSSIFGLMSGQGSVEAVVLGCLVEALGMLTVGLVLLHSLSEPNPEREP